MLQLLPVNVKGASGACPPPVFIVKTRSRETERRAPRKVNRCSDQLRCSDRLVRSRDDRWVEEVVTNKFWYSDNVCYCCKYSNWSLNVSLGESYTFKSRYIDILTYIAVLYELASNFPQTVLNIPSTLPPPTPYALPSHHSIIQIFFGIVIFTNLSLRLKHNIEKCFRGFVNVLIFKNLS